MYVRNGKEEFVFTDFISVRQCFSCTASPPEPEIFYLFCVKVFLSGTIKKNILCKNLIKIRWMS